MLLGSAKSMILSPAFRLRMQIFPANWIEPESIAAEMPPNSKLSTTPFMVSVVRLVKVCGLVGKMPIEKLKTYIPALGVMNMSTPFQPPPAFTNT